MTIQSYAADTLHSGWSFADALSTIFERVSTRLAARRRYRTVRAELLDYAPQELAELGISDADIDLVADDASRH